VVSLSSLATRAVTWASRSAGDVYCVQRQCPHFPLAPMIVTERGNWHDLHITVGPIATCVFSGVHPTRAFNMVSKLSSSILYETSLSNSNRSAGNKSVFVFFKRVLAD
jgi:hypothetical protein